MEQKDYKWYIVQCFSGKEEISKNRILQKIEAEDMSEMITDVYVPLKNKLNKHNQLVYKIEPDGRKKLVKTVKFIGYIFVKMNQFSDEAWFLIRNTEGVNGIIGSSGKGTKPTPTSSFYVENLKEEEKKLPNYLNKDSVQEKSINIKEGDAIKVINGAFINKIGKVIKIDFDFQRVTVNIESMGKTTPITIDLKEIEIL